MGWGHISCRGKNGQKNKIVTTKHKITKNKQTNKNFSGKSGIRGLIDTHAPPEPDMFKKPSPIN